MNQLHYTAWMHRTNRDVQVASALDLVPLLALAQRYAELERADVGIWQSFDSSQGRFIRTVSAPVTSEVAA